MLESDYCRIEISFNECLALSRSKLESDYCRIEMQEFVSDELLGVR